MGPAWRRTAAFDHHDAVAPHGTGEVLCADHAALVGLAQQGVGITPRELRMLSERYGNGAQEGLAEPLHVDLEGLIRDN